MKDYKEMYVALCEDFIVDFFAEHCKDGGGVEINCFWDAVEKSGLWIRGTYGTAMSEALERRVTLETSYDSNGIFCYNVFRLK